MALLKLLLLQALFFSLLIMMVPSHCRLDPTATRPAISQTTNTICGITASLLHCRTQCTKFPESTDSSAVVSSLPTILPAICVPDSCGGSGVICKKSDTSTEKSCQFSSEIVERLGALLQTVWETLKAWLEFLILGIGFVIFCVCCIRKFWADCCVVTENDVPHVLTFPDMENVEVFSFNEVETITNNFSNRIGSGGYSIVFLGQLSNNRQVAVKRHDIRMGSILDIAFKTEVKTLSKARHENIVDFIGYCTENNERILVYELISRNDLFEHLHPGSGDEKSMLFSSWKLRVKVLCDVAKGIEYLHRYAEPRIIHRDIKTENILIDENWSAKITDFGIAVFGPKPGSNYVELEVLSGSAGYLDPECNENNLRATPRNDVYSFGVVMLVVVTGQKVLGANTNLANLVAPAIDSGNLMDVLDKRLAVPVGGELEAVTRVARLATECVKVPGEERPAITAVLTELEGALVLFDP